MKISEMNVKELKEFLDDHNVAYGSQDKKDDLMTLAEKARKKLESIAKDPVLSVALDVIKASSGVDTQFDGTKTFTVIESGKFPRSQKPYVQCEAEGETTVYKFLPGNLWKAAQAPNPELFPTVDDEVQFYAGTTFKMKADKEWNYVIL